MSRDSYRFSALKTLVVFALSLPLPVRILAAAPAPTTTVLTVSPANTVDAGSLVTIRASVSSGGNAVSRCLILFCNADATNCLTQSCRETGLNRCSPTIAETLPTVAASPIQFP